MSLRVVTQPSYAERRFRPKNWAGVAARIAAVSCALAIGCAPPEPAAPPQRAPDAAPTAVIVDDGREVDIDKHWVPGKLTVIHFYADWCWPCHHVERWLALQQARHGDVIVRKVNVVDWDTPVVRQHIKKEPRELPLLVVFDQQGQRIAEVYGGRVSQLRRAFADARAKAR